MNQKARTIIFCIAGLLILAGAILFLTKWFLAPYLFAVGAAGMAVCHLTLSTKEMEFRERRLHPFQRDCLRPDDLCIRSDVQRYERVDYLPDNRSGTAALFFIRFRKATKIIPFIFPHSVL